MRAIVLVKQVPDLRAAPVGVRPDGTIDRQRAPAITNPADLHAVEAALRVADEVWGLSMGPPQAEEALREVIALGATRGVLLCDRLLAGSDTRATAHALAAAIGTMGRADVVLAGVAALDGQTGQVGPEVAQRLGWPQLTGCESLEVDGDAVVARRIVEGGYELVRAPLPAVVTVAETGFTPRYPSILGRRRAAAATIERLDAAAAGIDPASVGLVASPTKVARKTPAPLPDRECRMVGSDGFDVEDLARELADLATREPSRAGETAHEVARVEAAIGDGGGVSDAFEGTPALWVIGEIHGGLPARSTLELVSKAVELAPQLGGGTAAVLAGVDVAAAVEMVAHYGADVVYVAQDPALEPYRTEPHARVVADLATVHRPAAVLLAATTTGRDLAPRVAAMLDTGLAADCTDLAVEDWQRRGRTYRALLHQVRPAMAGGVLATCVCPEARPQMATVRPGVFALRPSPRNARIEPVNVAFAPTDLRVKVFDREIGHADVGLADADVIIAGGAGCARESWHLVEDLAGAVGGAVAASRAAVEAGLASRSLQVGQTGTTVRPRLYVACGISGALQHAVGMRAARTIVAINRDPDAPIFRLANYGIVADVRDALPHLTEALRATSRSPERTR